MKRLMTAVLFAVVLLFVPGVREVVRDVVFLTFEVRHLIPHSSPLTQRHPLWAR